MTRDESGWRSQGTLRTCLALFALMFQLQAASAQENRTEAEKLLSGISWQTGPGQVRLGSIATLSLPESFAFTGNKGARDFLLASENIPSGEELGILVPTTEGQLWFVVFDFDEIGYVKDDEKGQLDAEAILKSIREGTEGANKERRRRGWTTMDIVGWAHQPAYNQATHNLEWAVLGRSPDGDVVNHSIRLLGRRGVMRVGLVGDPEEIDAAATALNEVLNGFEFVTGQRYAEFRSGDKVAAVGLAGLILGGAAAAAIKTGFFTKFLKPIIVGLIALAAAFGRKLVALARGATGRGEANTTVT